MNENQTTNKKEKIIEFFLLIKLNNFIKNYRNVNEKKMF